MSASATVPTPEASYTRDLVSLRSQMAFVRALLDEAERVLPPGASPAMSMQLAEELARLGARFLELSRTLESAVDGEASGAWRLA